MEEIIRQFAAKESEFRRARENYTYRQSVSIAVLTLEGAKTGQRYHTVSDILFDNRGRRIEKILRAPQSTLRSIQLTQEDLDVTLSAHVKGHFACVHHAAGHVLHVLPPDSSSNSPAAHGVHVVRVLPTTT